MIVGRQQNHIASGAFIIIFSESTKQNFKGNFKFQIHQKTACRHMFYLSFIASHNI